MKLVLLPLDDRPVTYVFPQLLAKAAGVSALVPPRQLFGSLTRGANIEGIASWVNAAIETQRPDAVLACLDSVLYGGLINARRSSDTIKDIVRRIKHLESWQKITRKTTGKALAIFAQSSIMRISDNYDNTEEKPYWSQYGRELFSWSSQLHRLSKQSRSFGGDRQKQETIQLLETKVPPQIRKDYLQTRFRNFQVNLKLIELAGEGIIETLVLSQDDSGEFGLNVLERDRLIDHIQLLRLNERVFCYAGADEVICALLARSLSHKAGKGPNANLFFSPEEGAQHMSRYEGQPISKTIQDQMRACGINRLTGPGQLADFNVVVHTSDRQQGDHIWLPGHQDLRQVETRKSVDNTIKLLAESTQPCVLIDVAYANGADPALMQALLQKEDLVQKLWGYAGWNTTGNSAGAALALGVSHWFAQRQGMPSAEAQKTLKECLFTRMADDWAYQANVRGKLNGDGSLPSTSELLRLMAPYISSIEKALDYQVPSVNLSLPWNRRFEIEVKTEQTA